MQIKNNSWVQNLLCLIISLIIIKTNLIYFPFHITYQQIFQQQMSHLTIKRRRAQSLKSKLYSQQSRNLVPRHSITRILNDSLSKRRFTTHNSPEHSLSSPTMQAEVEQAKQLYKQRNTKNALIMFKKLYLKYPKNSQIPYYIGSCLLNENNFESALNYFRTCISIDQNVNKNVYLFMAICYKALSKLKQAIEILEIGCQKNHKFKDAYFYKGKIHLKRRQYQQASISFRKCLKIDTTDDLAKFFLAQSLRNLGSNEEALQKFDSLLKESPKLYGKSIIKKIQILLELKKYKQVSVQLKRAQANKVQSLELTFLKGIYEYQTSNYNDSSTFLQLTLSSNIGQPYLSKALQLLLQIKIKEKDFLGAEHLISRSKFMNMPQEQLIVYYKLVEGINDLIKRRLNDAEQKLEYVYAKSLHLPGDSQKFVQEVGSSFYAFCLFSLQKYQKALEIYKKNKSKKQTSKKVEDYNYLICEGIVFHKKKEFMLAEQKFKQASKLLQNKTEPFFLICVNIVQQNRDSFQQEQVKKKVFSSLSKYFKLAEKIQPQNPLFLFYESLVLLFEGEDACQTIQRAISISQEEISEYFFIQALALSLSGQTLKGLQSINKAIQLDHSIPEFYKQRSKYYYVLERYQEAVSDIASTLQQTNDEEAKLLLTFYYYMTQQYSLSLDLLKEVSEHCVEDKFKQFQMALNFRLHKYDKCGAAGVVVNSIIKRKLLDHEVLQKITQAHINERQNYSQFTVYFFHLLLSSYYFYNNQFDTCLEHLFGALEEIQLSAENQESYASISELMLNQIKFNISITSFLKQSKNSQEENKICTFSDTIKYIQMFLNETQDTDFIKVMQSLLQYIQKSQEKASQQKIKYIELYDEIPKVSNDFPQVTIFMNQNHAFKTKFMIVYPQKLKFNICPEFDESFLFNFDVDKIQSKLCPPWYKLHEGQIFFTDKIRNQSVLISETQKPPTPSLIMSPTPMPENLREKFKLDEAIEKKIQKLIQINKRKASSNKQLQGKVQI